MQFCIDQYCPIADFRSVQDLLASELCKSLALRRVEEAMRRMRHDEDRWHFHQVLLHFLGDAALSRSAFFAVRERRTCVAAVGLRCDKVILFVTPEE